MRYFTKSVFKEAMNCPVRLNYCNRPDYANQNLSDEFLEALAEGGFQVGELAKVYYGIPPENNLTGSNVEVAARTRELLKSDNVTIAEAGFIFGRCFCRVDVLRKVGNDIELIEVKAKSWGNGKNDGEDDCESVEAFLSSRKSGDYPKGSVKSDIREYVYDVAFQKYVVVNALRETFPGKAFSVKAALMLADKRKISDREGLNQFFRIVRQTNGRISVERKPGAEALKDGSRVLTPFWAVDKICDRIISGDSPDVRVVLHGMDFDSFVNEMSERYCEGRQTFDDIQLTTNCFKCPYYSSGHDSLRDGYDECWRKGTEKSTEPYVNYEARPLLEDLWGGMGGNVKGKILKSGKWFLDQITMEDIEPKCKNASDRPGLLPRLRCWVQIALATKRDEILGEALRQNIHNGVYLDVPGLRREMSTWQFPLHMIDFETSTAALPFYKGMKPYEDVAFQFSHHIIDSTDGGRTYTIKHAGQWINVESGFPNFEFVRQLKRSLGDRGTIFRYSNHENTILRHIRRQLLERNDQPDTAELVAFIDSITHLTGDEDGGGTPAPREMVDLWDIVKRFYHDPRMKGSNSIKVVLPAVLNASRLLKDKYSNPIYGSEIQSLNYSLDNPKTWIEMDGTEVLNPYKQLDEISSFFPESSQDAVRRAEMSLDESEGEFNGQINNGGAALWAYGLLQFCLNDREKRNALVQALLRYCELDTMAMVFIWEYFNEMAGEAVA